MEDTSIHISRGGKELGQFPSDEIVKHLSSGLLMRTDLAWQDGMTEWKPIYEIVEAQQFQSDDLPPSLGSGSLPPVAIHENGQVSSKMSLTTKYLIAGCVVFGCVICGVIGVFLPDEIGGESEGGAVISDADKEEWFKKGTLHNASLAEWGNSSYDNKLATAADWLTATKWKGALNSTDDFDRLKVKADMLVKAVDKVATADATQNDSLSATEIAAAIVTMSNDLGP
jgi:hypothetical protein